MNSIEGRLEKGREVNAEELLEGEKERKERKEKKETNGEYEFILKVTSLCQ